MPFVDGSCRREPDLEATLPSITALCRGGLFAPRLAVGDRVAYITKKGPYGIGARHWRLTALLQVVERFETHNADAAWYRQRGLAVPRNCIVHGNSPVPLECTDGEVPSDLRARLNILRPDQIVRLWDARYAKRAKEHGVVLACEAIYRELTKPPKIYEQDWIGWVGRVPVTRNPPKITQRLWSQIEHVTRRSS
jgi:hypothetical protein